MVQQSRPLPPEYTGILRGVGLAVKPIADLHDLESVPSEAGLHAQLASQVSVDSTDDLYVKLSNTLERSPVGVGSPGEYWNSAPEIHLNQLLNPRGLELELSLASTHDYRINLRDATGSTYTITFDYPATPLGDNNYPALIHALNTRLLDATPLTITRLTAPDNEWRFLLITDDQKSALQSRYGEQVTVFGYPLFADDQPEAFADDGSIPIPDWYEVKDEAPKQAPHRKELTISNGESFWQTAIQTTDESPEELISSSTEGLVQDPSACSPSNIEQSTTQERTFSAADKDTAPSNEELPDLEELPDPRRSLPGDSLTKNVETDGKSAPPSRHDDRVTGDVDDLFTDLSRAEQQVKNEVEQYSDDTDPTISEEPEIPEQSDTAADSVQDDSAHGAPEITDQHDSDGPQSFLDKVEREAADESTRDTADKGAAINEDDLDFPESNTEDSASEDIDSEREESESSNIVNRLVRKVTEE